jgi:transcriptional regulator with XRE-family HTH domain
MGMNQLMQQSDRFRRAAEVEAETPITAGAAPADGGRLTAGETAAEWVALAKLVELRRRSIGWTPLQLAERAGVSYPELLRLEEGVPGPAVLEKLPVIARALSLPEKPLLELAGVVAEADDRIRRAARRFVGRAVGVTAPTAGESEALEEFVQALDAG